jgi:hypothetical protein
MGALANHILHLPLLRQESLFFPCTYIGQIKNVGLVRCSKLLDLVRRSNSLDAFSIPMLFLYGESKIPLVRYSNSLDTFSVRRYYKQW